MDSQWENIKSLARKLTEDYADSVFIGGVAVATHAISLGSQFQESSHDLDLYLSFSGKAVMRDRYEIHRTHIQKDSATIEGEDVDLYIENQNPLCVPYSEIFAESEEVDGIRVAALEHLLVLKLDAAKSRAGSGKGEKDARDLARIVALLGHPRTCLLEAYMDSTRLDTFNRIMGRGDLAKLLGLNPMKEVASVLPCM